ncbi:dynein light chain Tctex-type 4-like [Frankliniella occidentalis]|uniref:Dynein light chain Tctex-type 4-like n=1 Tax=Frankliniella occidentalis TaxID=133901 RepID=A0A6J1RZ42_FRAOC|nr:dynein light chain Tctex-type 4-like [Frankliniella occidentalis]
MHEMLGAAEYDPVKSGELAGAVAAEVRTRIQELNFDRYKVACVVNIYEKLFQGIHSELGYLWDVQRDHFATYYFSNTHIIATGTVFGVYFE